jgi:rhamnogalacturonan endolyase
MYLDHVKTGLSLNGQQLDRAGIEPNFIDTRFAVTVPTLPAEVLRMTSGPFSNQMTGKYSYNVDYAKLGTWGRASDTNKIGEWVVVGSPECISDGPTVRDYVNGWGLMYYMPVGGHYDDTAIVVKSNADWTKIFGPWALYFNSPSNGIAGWQDAQNQAMAEQQAWPYAWLTNSAVYQPKNQRANVTGKLIINDALRPGAGAAGVWIGLAAPDAGVENAPDNWQFQSDGYQYWVHADGDGTFTIPNVQTFSPYGGPATYQLYACCDGTNQATGEIGEFSTGPFTFASGATTNLGTLTWNVPHRGGQMVWEIGIPDRTAAEFRHGDEFAKPALWWNFTNEFTNPLEYSVAANNWSNALNYCHSVDNMPSTPWKWHLNFTLPAVRPGTYWLNIAYATAASIQVIRVNNDSTIFTTFTPTNGNPGASTYLRQGIHAKYTVARVPIPSGNLRAGTNTITLDHEVHSNHSSANFMYDYLDLEGPAVATPKINFYSTSNNRLIVRGTNGTTGVTYFAMTSTNLALPLAQWTPVYTNTFDGSGNFAVTNSYTAGTPQKYFVLQVP